MSTIINANYNFMYLGMAGSLKSVSSKKASKLRAERRRTGNFPMNESPLQNIEKRVISAIGMDYGVCGGKC